MVFKHLKIESLNDFFKGLSERGEKGVYFYRINGYSPEVNDFLHKYYEAARKAGAVIEGRLANPDDKNLSYYKEMMGSSFFMSTGFINLSLKKWLPRMNDYQREMVAGSIYDCLEDLRKAGKNENMLKNAYIKFMCWLYYKFEGIVGQLGNNTVPKILCEAAAEPGSGIRTAVSGGISSYELLILSILVNSGCDAVLLQQHGDSAYLKLDPGSLRSYPFEDTHLTAFPDNYGIVKLRSDLQSDYENARLYGPMPRYENCTNAWIEGRSVLADVGTPIVSRGKDFSGLHKNFSENRDKFFFNCFCRINGAEDRLTYENELLGLYRELTDSGRKIVVTDGEIPAPSTEEIGAVKRKNAYYNPELLLSDMAANLRDLSNAELMRIAHKAFIDVMLPESKKAGISLNKLMNSCVYLLAYIKRYLPKLLPNWRYPEVGCFIHFGPCVNGNEALFLKFLSRLPVDVLVLVPDLNGKCVLSDKSLYEENHGESLSLSRFPRRTEGASVGTSAYYAERELDSLMYQDSGLYRNQQYGKADAVSLKTMYEEIFILWKEEVKYRPGFGTTGDRVNIPVIFAKVSGVKDGNLSAYWNGIRELLKEETFLITEVPHIDGLTPNPIKASAPSFLKRGKLFRDAIKNHRDYKYGFLRDEVQEHMLDKLQLLLDQRLIKGTYENGTEYTIIATVLNMGKEIMRMLQKFDFTKKNPKLIYIIAGEEMLSLEDSIMAAFLNLSGFDIVFFVPTGYQSVEKHFNDMIFEEHQAGEYIYDLKIPQLKAGTAGGGNWFENLFKGKLI